MKQVVQIESVSVGYSSRSVVLSDLALSAKEASLILIVGENGSGKSTLLKTIGGLLSPVSGNIKLFDKAFEKWDKKQLAKRVSYVATNSVIKHLITVEEFVYFGRYPYSNWFAQKSKEDKTLVAEVMELCELIHLSSKMISEISDGERQRVFIARALAQNTDLLILDEPTTHLDIKNTRSIFNILKNLKEEKKKTILFSSHQVEKALDFADLVWIVDKGRVLETTPEELSQNNVLKEIVFGEE